MDKRLDSGNRRLWATREELARLGEMAKSSKMAACDIWNNPAANRRKPYWERFRCIVQK